MVKQKCNFKYQTTTADFPKISSPKVRDDPFGSSSPRIAYGFLYRSDLRGFTLDSPITTFLKFREKPYGLLLSCDASDVSDRADFLLIPWFSLSCFVDLRSSYVLALDRTCFVMDLHSSILGFAAYVVQPGEYLVIDKLFGETQWLNLKLELLFIFGSLLRPPESYSASRSWCKLSELILVWFMHPIYKHLDSGIVYCGVAHELCMDSKDSSRHSNLSRQGEIWLENLMQNQQFGIATRCLELSEVGVQSKIVLASCCVDEFINLVSMVHEAVIKLPFASQGLRVINTHTSDLLNGLHVIDVPIQILQLYASRIAHLLAAQRVLSYQKTDPGLVCVFLGDSLVSWKSKQLDVVYRSSNEAEYSLMSNTACELDWLSNLLHDLHVQLVDSIVLYYANQAALHIVSSLVYNELLQRSFPTLFLQGQSQDYDFIRYTIVAHSIWFGSILELLYCSLPRPPDNFCDFNFLTSHGVFKSKMQVPSILRGSIRDIDLVGLVMV